MVVITQLDWVIQTFFVFVMSNPPGAERHIASFEISHIRSKGQKRFIFYLFPATSLLDPCPLFIPFTIHFFTYY
jgi:hypothetical protein